MTYRQWSGVAVLAVILGCTASKVASRTSQATLDELSPESSPGTKAVLSYNGQLVDVDLVHKREGSTETIDLMRNGESLEHETYVRTPHSFSLKEADEDQFDPPLPLLSAEAAAPWSGQLTSGGVSHAASATVESSVDTLKGKTVQPATLVTVNLELDSGGAKKANRTLKFWLVRGKGVVEREFGMGVKRLPAE
ncbi:MAG TPA: hypothetical protein VKT78_00270 [Fimbriimonadaceae bacterium]|nr:hypothetical protein [Fimbriimonadaceae bacterium]